MCDDVDSTCYFMEDKMEHRVAKKAGDQKAQGMVEYALLLAFVVVVSMALVAGSPKMLNEMGNVFGSTASALNGK